MNPSTITESAANSGSDNGRSSGASSRAGTTSSQPTKKKLHVLVVGQTPPPLVGQWIMIEKMLQGSYANVELFHVRMAFSNAVDQIGQFRMAKPFHLLAVVVRIWLARFRHQTEVLYYPPAGPHRVPVYRDIAILLMTRWLFKSVIFHFHAGGVSDLYPALPWFIKPLFRRAYHGAEMGIRLTPLNPDDSHALHSNHDIVIPNGIDDLYAQYAQRRPRNELPEILFVGMVCEAKGVFVLLDACRHLKSKGLKFRCRLVGSPDSPETRNRIEQFITDHDLTDEIIVAGVLQNQQKWRAFAEADIFCFPTHYQSESFGLVAIEAMQFELPLVATDWRGISTIVQDGETGFLVPIRDSEAVAEKLAWLIENPELAQKMGKRGRECFLSNYTIEKFYENIERAFCVAASRDA